MITRRPLSTALLVVCLATVVLCLDAIAGCLTYAAKTGHLVIPFTALLIVGVIGFFPARTLLVNISKGPLWPSIALIIIAVLHAGIACKHTGSLLGLWPKDNGLVAWADVVAYASLIPAFLAMAIAPRIHRTRTPHNNSMHRSR